MISIILDTNIWIAFVAKDKPNGLLEILKKKNASGEVILLSNDIILKEWLRNKEQTIKDITNSIKGLYKSLRKVANFLDGQDKTNYLTSIESVLKQEEKQISLATNRVEETEILLKSCKMTPITNEMKLKVIDWALDKRAPFLKKANSVGDALILLSSVEYCKTKTLGITDSIFVSFNHEDYADRKDVNKIHQDLEELFEDANLTFKRNIGEALDLAPQLTKEISDYIDYRVEDWIEWQTEIARGK